MVESSHLRIEIPDRTYQASARAEIKLLAEKAGFSDHRLGQVQIVIAELTSNLWKHSPKGGYLLVRILQKEPAGIEIISIDNGPGILQPALMMEDGQSTSKTLGQGLGAIRRLSNVFDLYTLKGWGTILLSKIFVDEKVKEKTGNTFHVAGLNVSKSGFTVSGDAWSFIQQGKKIRLIVVDGLGHGEQANEAATAAVMEFQRSPSLAPVVQLKALHDKLKKTRGAVVNVVHVDFAANQLSYCGVGNISMKIISPAGSKGCVSYNGIVGHIMPGVLNNHVFQWQANDIIILHSDGVSARWDISKYPLIGQHHPLMLCAAIYKDHNRGSDDSTVVIGKWIKQSYE